MQIFDAQNFLVPELIDHNLQQEILSVVQECFGPKTLITSIHVLTDSSRRNQVMRLKLESSMAQVPSSVILKRSIFKESFENQSETLGRFARDWAGLEFLSSLNCDVIPKFYGGDRKSVV